MTVPRIVGVVVCSFLFGSAFSQNVGINTTTPGYPLDVNGEVRTSGNVYVGGKLGFGTTTPLHNIHMVDGSMGFTSSVDNVTWVFGYKSASDFLFIAEDTDIRAVMKRGGNVGIGTQNPTAKLDVNGSIHSSTNVMVNGYITVNNGKGILQNSQGSGQLKYFTKQVSFNTGAMSAFGVGGELSIAFNAGIFTTAPKVSVGNIVTSSGTTGDPYHVQLVIYDVTTTGCKAKIVNLSPNAVDYAITWNVDCIGQ